jgi:proteasome-associated ATPase
MDFPALFRQLVDVGENAPNPEAKRQIARLIRGHSRETAEQLDAFLLEEVTRLRTGLNQALAQQRKLAEVFERLSAPPWHPAVFLGAVESGEHRIAMVAHGATRRVVTLAEGVELSSLRVGDEVFLGPELNVVVAASPGSLPVSGETAVFDRSLPDGRVVLRARDEEVVVQAAAGLGECELRSGDLVRWDRALWIAFERVERSQGSHLFLEETPAETFAAVGGLDRQIEQLTRTLRLHLEHASVARKYRLRRKGSVLLAGPPGTGKTLVARALANWLAQLSPRGRSRFMNIKPGSLHSVWYSQSEANYREAFRVAREAGERDAEVPVVMFFDEVDAVGAARGGATMRVDDRVLTAFMTELDGLDARGNVLVVAATNRRDALDPALLRPGRLGDLVLEVPRPNRSAAREIFARHLDPSLPYAAQAEVLDGPSARAELIEAAVTRIYSPNGHGDLATVTFRDGKRRPVGAADLVSGAVIAKVARTAVERACHREVETGESGVRPGDLMEAIDAEFDAAARVLTPGNCHRYLDGLPQDVDVVRVEIAPRRAKRVHRFLSVA